MNLQLNSNPTRVLATGRIAIAMLGLLFASTDPGKMGFELEFDDFSVLVYLAFAITAAFVIWNNWWRDHWLAPWFVAVDGLAFVVLPLDLEPEVAAYQVVAVVIASLIIVETSYYWSAVLARRAAILLNVICFGICLRHSFDSMGSLVDETLRRAAVLAFVSSVVLWLCSRTQHARVGKLREEAGSFGDGLSLMDSALDYVMLEGRGSGAAIAYESRKGRKLAMANAGALDSDELMRPTGRAFAGSIATYPVLLFDRVRGHGLTCNGNRQVSAVWLTDEERDGLAEIGADTGLLLSVPRSAAKTCFVLTGISGLNRRDLFQGMAMGIEIADARETRDLAQASKLLTEGRLRETIARDLHDGVAQSLAGAQYWLNAMARKVATGSQIDNLLREVAEAFHAEQLHVREMIGSLRQEEFKYDSQDLGAVLRALTARLARQWQCSIAVTGPDDPVLAAPELSLHIKQLAREAIANAVQHGSADRIAVALRRDRSTIELTIEDNGSGFDPTKAIAVPRSIAERVSELGGEIAATSRPKATILFCKIPEGAIV
jgi:signal transduction histidine kinase